MRYIVQSTYSSHSDLRNKARAIFAELPLIYWNMERLWNVNVMGRTSASPCAQTNPARMCI
jgi:hypothetical protein